MADRLTSASDTPIESIAETARAIEPALLVLARGGGRAPLRELASRRSGSLRTASSRVAVAGPGAHGIDAPGVLALSGDPVAEAERVSALV